MADEVLTVHELNERMLGFIDAMRRISTELRRSIKEYAKAENEYRTAFSNAILTSDGSSEDKRKAQAHLATAAAYEAFRIKEMTRQCAERELRAASDALSATQSLAASHRAETRLAGYEPS